MIYTFELADGSHLHNIELISPYKFQVEWGDSIASFRLLLSVDNLRWINVFGEKELVNVLINYKLVGCKKENDKMIFEIEQKRRKEEWL